jgi:hypothetical protein
LADSELTIDLADVDATGLDPTYVTDRRLSRWIALPGCLTCCLPSPLHGQQHCRTTLTKGVDRAGQTPGRTWRLAAA